MDDYRKANRSLWNEWTKINSESELYRLDEFRSGENKLNQLEIDEVGDVRGKSLLHLQCHFGMDTLSWAMLGANVTGVDFSPEAIRLAKQLSVELNLPAKFVCSDLYELPDVLSEKYDIVYTSYGVLTWLPDIKKWAETVGNFVRPGGFFYIAEFHPFAMTFDDQPECEDWRMEYDYFSKEMLVFDVLGSYADRSAPMNQKKSYEWQHTLGDVISSLIQSGLTIEFLHEHAHSVYEMFPFLTRSQDGLWRIPGSMKQMPLMFSIKATKN